MLDLNAKNVRHLFTMLRRGARPAEAVYDSLGDGFFLAPAPEWLNLGLWEGKGDVEEAPRAVRRLVERVAAPLPTGGVILDVGNGLGAQDPVIARVTSARTLIAVNITASQLTSGRHNLKAARAEPLVADAVRLPIADESIDGIISVEAAFHFSSRPRFFAECERILKPGGVVSISDFSVARRPDTLREKMRCLGAIRIWGVRADAVVTADDLVAQAEGAGLTKVDVWRCGAEVIDPALRMFHHKLQDEQAAPALHRAVGAKVVRQWESLRSDGIMDYALLSATKPVA